MAGDMPLPTSSLTAVRAKDWTNDHARHLLWRAGFGGTPQQIEALGRMEPEKAVDTLLDFERGAAFPDPSPDEFDDSLMREPTEEERAMARAARKGQDEDTLARLRLLREQREAVDRQQIYDMQRWWLRRMIETPRPLEEKLTLFWHGHFATSYRTIENSWHMFQQNQLFRKHAAGNFGTLLGQIIRDPAMIAYLDNNESRKGRPNENLARELMELFSLGVGAYSERDIKEGARALTGYTFEGNEFRFRSDWHDADAKTILGRTGNLDGEDFVQAILAKREAAELISAKLYRFFVGDIPLRGVRGHQPVQAVLKSLAITLGQANYEVRPMLKRLFLSEHFYEPANRLALTKSPVEVVVGTVRAFATPVRDLSILNDALDLMGQRLFFPPSVKGWDGGRSWVNTSTLFIRQNITNFLLTGRTPEGVDPLARTEAYDPMSLLTAAAEQQAGAERDLQALASFLVRFALGFEPSPEKRDAIAQYVRGLGGVSGPNVLKTLALITAMPEYQLC